MLKISKVEFLALNKFLILHRQLPRNVFVECEKFTKLNFKKRLSERQKEHVM